MKKGKKIKRPSVWIGHIFRKVKDVGQIAEFYVELGMRLLMQERSMAILELRGGTHLLLFRDTPKNKRVPHQEFDLMVEDIRAFHASLKKKNLKISAIKKEHYHLRFYVTAPDGDKVMVSSDHTNGRSV